MGSSRNNSLSERIAEFSLELDPRSIPADVFEHTKMLILDALGVAMASFNLPHARAVRDTVLAIGGKAESTLWGIKHKVPAFLASLVNATMVHGMDFDDTHVPGIVHPSSCVVPTAFSVAEFSGSKGRDVISAIVIGLEVMTRLGAAAHGGFHDRGYHATGILGGFASACVASRLLGTSKAVLVNALGICGSQAAALQQFLHDGSWVKRIHPGWASHSGIFSVLLAQRGFLGPTEVFEGEFGLWNSHLGHTNGLEECFDDLGRRWYAKEISVKLYPCCHFTHSYIDCAIHLRSSHRFDIANVERIECRVSPRTSKICCEPISEKRKPATEYAARFSLPYVVSVGLMKGRVGPSEFQEACLVDPAVLQTIQKVDCVLDEGLEIPGRFPGWVKVYLSGGTTFEYRQLSEKGTPENPITREDVIAKAKNNMDTALSEKAIHDVVETVRNFEEKDDAVIRITNVLAME